MRHRAPTDRLPSEQTAAAAARNWIDERLRTGDLTPSLPHPRQLHRPKPDDPPTKRADDGATMKCFVNVPELGRVCITARRLKHTRGRSTHYFWTADSAGQQAR